MLLLSVNLVLCVNQVVGNFFRICFAPFQKLLNPVLLSDQSVTKEFPSLLQSQVSNPNPLKACASLRLRASRD